MKRTSLALITTALLIALPAQSFAATKTSVTKPKSAGSTVAAIPNTILSGTTPPSSAIGINGDFYIDVKNANIYGPKSKGKWLTPTSLRGIAGTNGTRDVVQKDRHRCDRCADIHKGRRTSLDGTASKPC